MFDPHLISKLSREEKTPSPPPPPPPVPPPHSPGVVVVVVVAVVVLVVFSCLEANELKICSSVVWDTEY